MSLLKEQYTIAYPELTQKELEEMNLIITTITEVLTESKY